MMPLAKLRLPLQQMHHHMSNPQLTEQITHDHELDVLSQPHQNNGVKQRDLAQAIGLSLGMTNAILKRLAGKGFVTMRKLNARNIHYLVTPEGVDLIARRSYRYLRRTVGHVGRYKERMLGSAPRGPGGAGELTRGRRNGIASCSIEIVL
ncbi:MAG: winged helix-turn-helix transcriptional regulator [Spirochaetales bacterium]